MAILAFILDHLTGSSTFRTGLDISYSTKEGLLCIYNLSLTSALRAGLSLCSGLSSASMAGRAWILYCKLKLLLTAKNSLQEGNPYAGTKVGPLGRSASCAASSSSASKEITLI